MDEFFGSAQRKVVAVVRMTSVDEFFGSTLSAVLQQLNSGVSAVFCNSLHF